MNKPARDLVLEQKIEMFTELIKTDNNLHTRAYFFQKRKEYQEELDRRLYYREQWGK
ncbi:hypothetical protein TROLL_15 [Bacillus phage Troll]|uniref:Uncharacterized protein n=1 Tax=Bacillus phage Troll TaxID=1382932 RepID=S5Y6Q3_9CAUD|nr:hypothetical protein TROLL_15 [Bacillus phage Troll]AGT13457.1 hypothetical protein TROLL_15 [Bacillus phage Troll]